MSDDDNKDSTASAHMNPEWSHRVEVADITNTALRKKISASPQQRKDLARRMDVVSLDKLEADMRIMRTENKFLIHAQGTFNALVTQKCVVTNDDIQSMVEGDVEGWFAEEGKAVSLARARHEKMSRSIDSEVPLLEEEEDPEIIEDGTFDLGELVAQHLILDLPPYPRKEDADHPDIIKEEDLEQQDQKINNPFAALKNWKEKQGRSD